MKKLLLILLSLIAVSCAAFFCACGSSGSDGETPEVLEPSAFTGITFADKTVTYDGSEQELTVTGTVPEGTQVAYTGNKGTDAGVYNASVTLSKTGYRPLTLTAKFTINKATFTGITFTDKKVTYDGSEQELTVTGTLPANTQVSYTGNKGTNAGVYDASVTLTNPNYNDLTLNAKLTIEQPLLTFTGITFVDKTVTYNGSEHELTVTGTVPADTTVTYTGNKGTDAGVYSASVTLSKTGYANLTLTAKLTINKATFTGITFEGKTFVATGSAHTITISGELPQGSTVNYQNNSKTAAGEYTATATVTNLNYNDLVLTAKLKILNLANVALDAINMLLDKPDAWSFLPEAFAQSEMAYTSAPVSDFTSFVNVSSISDKIIGKQFNVLYEGLIHASAALGYVDTVYAAVATIAGVYQSYINDNPENYASFTGQAAGFKFKITLSGNNSEIIIGNSTVSLELTYDKDSGERTGRIQVTDGIAIKYVSTENTLKLAIKATIAGVGNLKQIEFARSGNAVAGYLYEYTGTETKNLKTSAVIESNSQYTWIMSNKRETEDMAIKGYEEVYDSRTGKYLGGRVEETIKVVNYDTLWFMLDDVSGFITVKVSPEQNGLNLDTVYVNGSTSAFETKKVNPILPTSSRRFDIEMKDVWYVTATNEDGKVKYDTVKYSIPMLFVQTEQTDDFGADVKDKNSSVFTTNPVLPSLTPVISRYDSLKTLFDTIKENVAYTDINSFIGTENEFFA